MDKRLVALAQQLLAEARFYSGAVDGIRDDRLHDACEAALHLRHALLDAHWQTWSAKRKLIAFLQCACHEAGFDSAEIDGWQGTTTDHALGAFLDWRETGAPPRLWRDETPRDVNPNGWPAEADVEAVFGPRGFPHATPPPPRLAEIPCPWPLKLSWSRNRGRSTIRVHERVADSLARVLARVRATYRAENITTLGFNLLGGDYEVRRMRGGSRWSMHCWGIAIDWDTVGNPLLAGRDTARFAGPDYLDWWAIWEEEGWVSLGRTRNHEWGHVQAAKLPR